MPYLLSRMRTIGAQFETDSRRGRRDISELISHGAAANNGADPEGKRKRGAELRAWRGAAGRIPVCHFRIQQFLIQGGIDSRQQKEDQLRPEERIPVSLSGLGNK